jgi:hypothetical protein
MFGLSLCSKCLKKYSVKLGVALNRDLDSLHHELKDRIASQSERYYFKKDFFSYGRESNGSIITKLALEFLKSCENKEMHSYTTRFEWAFEDYLKAHEDDEIKEIFLNDYDEILEESVKLRKQKKRERFEVIKNKILDEFSSAPWYDHVVDSKYFKEVTQHLLQAPLKGTKKALQAIVNDIRLKYDTWIPA